MPDVTLLGLYADYLAKTSEKKDRDQRRLFVTDLGKCLRQVWYRINGHEKNKISKESADARAVMFDVAEHIEMMLSRALADAEYLLAYQYDVPILDRENWGGRLDFITDRGGVRIEEAKTVRSNFFDHPKDMLKEPHRLQAGCYDHYIREEGIFELNAPPIVAYFDRGGSNPPVEFEIEYDSDEIITLMDEIDDMRASNYLPPKLEKRLKMRSYGKTVMLEPPWDCDYCDYSDSCRPDMQKNKWAEKEGHVWTFTKKADFNRLHAFVKQNVRGTVTWRNDPASRE